MALTEKYVSTTGGGAHDGSSEANAFSLAEMITDINAGGKAGNRYNVKADATYSRTTSTDSFTAGGTSTAPVIIRGYLTAIGDGYLGRTGDNGPLITTNMPVLSYTTGVFALNAAFIIVESIRFTSARNAPAVNLNAADIVLRSCNSVNSASGTASTAITLASGAVRGAVIDCDAIVVNGGNAGDAAIVLGGSGGRIIACRVSSTSNGIESSAGTAALISGNTIFECAIGIAITSTTAYAVIHGNTISDCSGDAIDIVTGTTVTHLISNNIFTDNGGYAIDFNNAAVASVLSNNRYRDNTSGNINLGTDWVTATNWGAVTTDTGGPETDYVDAASDNYNLIASSPAVNAGLPLNAAIGALQRDQSGGGGATETSAAYIG